MTSVLTSVQTALALVPLEEHLWQAVQPIREKMDPAYSRWPLHLNLAFPFIPIETFDSFARDLAAACAHMKPFQVTFNNLAKFERPTSATHWIQMTQDGIDRVRELHGIYRRVYVAMMGLKDSEVEASIEFIPHLTLAKTSTKQRNTQQFDDSAVWEPITVIIDTIWMLARTDDHISGGHQLPFSPRYAIRIGESIPVVYHTSPISLTAPLGSQERHGFTSTTASRACKPLSLPASSSSASTSTTTTTTTTTTDVAQQATTPPAVASVESPSIVYELRFPTERQARLQQVGQSMRTAEEIFDRIKWDARFSLDDFTIGWFDRVSNKITEISARAWDTDTRRDITSDGFIPAHRVRTFSYRNQIVWNRETKLDLLSLCQIVPVMDAERRPRFEPPVVAASADDGTAGYKPKRDAPFVKASHFIGFQVAPSMSDEQLDSVSAVQRHLVQQFPEAEDLLVSVPTLHMTLSLLRLSTPEQEQAAIRATRAFASALGGPLHIDLRGLADFGGRCVYAEVHGPGKKALEGAAKVLLHCLKDEDLEVGDQFEFVPHVSLARVPARSSIRIPTEAWEAVKSQRFGRVEFTSVDLTIVDGNYRADGYYSCAARVPLDNLHTNNHDGIKRRLVIFDFDSTLFRSPQPDAFRWSTKMLKALSNKKRQGGLGWFDSSLPLQVPHWSSLFVPSMVSTVRRAMSDPSNYIILLSGRSELCRPAIASMLKEQGLHFDDIVLRPESFHGHTSVYKAQQACQLVHRIPTLQLVTLYEDDPVAAKCIEQSLAGYGVSVTANVFDYGCSTLPRDLEYEIGLALLQRQFSEVNISREVVFTGIRLTEESRELLFEHFPFPTPMWTRRADHVTLNLGPPPKLLVLNEPVTFHVTAYGINSVVSAVKVALPEHLLCAGDFAHVTLGVTGSGENFDAHHVSHWDAVDAGSIQLAGITDIFERFVVDVFDHDVSANQLDQFGLIPLHNVAASYGEGVVETLEALGIVHKTKDRGAARLRQFVLDTVSTIASNRAAEFIKGGKCCVHAVGSYRVGVYSRDADVDLVLLTNAGRLFVTELAQALKQHDAVGQVRVIDSAKVPIIHAIIGGVDVDLQFSFAGAELPPFLATSDRGCAAIYDSLVLLEGDTADVNLFRVVLALVKHWAKCRGIHHCRFGYPGGLGLAVMVKLVCSLHPANSVWQGLQAFFQHYAAWDWARFAVSGTKPVEIITLERGVTGAMIILGCEQLNIARNSTTSSLATFTKELNRAATCSLLPIPKLMASARKTWQKEFGTFISISVCARTQDALSMAASLVESRLIGLMINIERRLQVHVQIYPEQYKEPQPSRGYDHAIRYAVGVQSDADDMLQLCIKDYVESVYSASEWATLQRCVMLSGSILHLSQ